jgi:hypothetical protein
MESDLRQVGQRMPIYFWKVLQQAKGDAATLREKCLDIAM